MKRTLIALISMTFLAVPLGAQESLFYDLICSTGSFEVCASVRLHTEGNQLRMQVWNLEGLVGGQHTMNAIGLYHLGAAWTGAIESYSVVHQINETESVDITNYWSRAGAGPITTLSGIDLELQEGALWFDRGIIGCTDPGVAAEEWASNPMKWATCHSFSDAPYVQFNFNLSEAFTLANTEVRWSSTQLANGGQLKCDTGGAGYYAPCEAVVLPEPASLLLLASGLVGVVGIGSRRRRKEDEEGVSAE